MVDWTRGLVNVVHKEKGLECLDERIKNVLDISFVGHFRLPTCSFWKSGTSLQGNELRSLMQVMF